MSLLSLTTNGKEIGAQIHTIAGNNGVGKTTWAASFPNVLIADLENGSRHISGVERLSSDKIPDTETLRLLLKELLNTKHEHKTFVVDSVEALEGMISDAVCLEGKVDSIEKYEGGYGKGYTRSREIMREFMSLFQALRAKGITTILVAHTQVKSQTDPASNQTYDRVIMRCNDKVAAIIRDLSDNVFYATHKVLTVENKNKKTEAFSDGERVMYTQWRPGYDAKNRLDLPHELPLTYSAFVTATSAIPTEDASGLLSEIDQMVTGLKPALQTTVKKELEKIKTNPAKLRDFKSRLMTFATA